MTPNPGGKSILLSGPATSWLCVLNLPGNYIVLFHARKFKTKKQGGAMRGETG
jgi:hypothetical protein